MDATADSRRGTFRSRGSISTAPRRARRDYNALELTAPAGAVVTVIERYGQWALVEAEGGTRGWIPEENLEGLR